MPTATPQPTPSSSVGHWVTYNPAFAQTFEKLSIDFCCGGKTALDQACEALGLDLAEVLEKLDEEAAAYHTGELDYSKLSLTDLCTHIVTIHHHYLMDKLPFIQGLINRVVRAHGHKDPRLQQLLETFSAVKDELLLHMQKEEQILFPIIKQLEQNNDGTASAHCGNINNPIRMMESEHDDAGKALQKIKELTGNYTPPEDACRTYLVMLSELKHFELDMHQHIHKENNILFPAAAALEQELSQHS